MYICNVELRLQLKNIIKALYEESLTSDYGAFCFYGRNRRMEEY